MDTHAYVEICDKNTFSLCRRFPGKESFHRDTCGFPLMSSSNILNKDTYSHRQQLLRKVEWLI